MAPGPPPKVEMSLQAAWTFPPGSLQAVLGRLKEERFTGKVLLNFSQGTLGSLRVEESSKVREREKEGT